MGRREEGGPRSGHEQCRSVSSTRRRTRRRLRGPRPGRQRRDHHREVPEEEWSPVAGWASNPHHQGRRPRASPRWAEAYWYRHWSPTNQQVPRSRMSQPKAWCSTNCSPPDWPPGQRTFRPIHSVPDWRRVRPSASWPLSWEGPMGTWMRSRAPSTAWCPAWSPTRAGCPSGMRGRRGWCGYRVGKRTPASPNHRAPHHRPTPPGLRRRAPWSPDVA